MKKFLITVVSLALFFCVIYFGWAVVLSDTQAGKAKATPAPTPQAVLQPVPDNLLDEGVFADDYLVAYQYLKDMSAEQKLAQLLWIRVPHTADATKIIKELQPGGIVMFKKDFANLSEKQVQINIQDMQEVANIPMLVAVDEEGGSVVRASQNEQLRDTPFAAPSEIYQSGKIDAMVTDAKEKSEFLLNLGVNVVLAPVADVSTNPEDYINNRTMGQPAGITANYITRVVTQFNQSGLGCVLKHFPGYGNNVDTHTGIAIDERSIESFWQSDLRPFENGINANAPCVLVSHNIANAFDTKYPASLSKPVHIFLREELGFTGVVTTDELDMGAIEEFADGETTSVAAFLAGNDMLMLTDYEAAYASLLQAYQNGKIPQDQLDKSVLRILAWKVQLGVLE